MCLHFWRINDDDDDDELCYVMLYYVKVHGRRVTFVSGNSAASPTSSRTYIVTKQLLILTCPK